MQLRLFAQIVPGVATASVTSALALAIIATTTSNQPSYAGGNKFFCTQDNGVPVTKVRTSRGNETFRGTNSSYRIQTPDGRVYNATVSQAVQFQDNDLAVLQFRSSDVIYTVATIGDSSSLKVGDRVFVGGFTFNPPSGQAKEMKNKFVFTSGKILLLLDKALEQGYQIGYTNDVRKGMSGSPLLNYKGEVVGINSLHKDPVWDTAEVYKDGSQPEQQL